MRYATEISRADAITYVKSACETSQWPTLTDAEVETLVDEAAARDADEYRPIDSQWTPTYDLSQAIVEGWQRKAGKATAHGSVDYQGAGGEFNRKHIFEHCQAMAEEYRKGRAISLEGSSPDRDEDAT